MATGAEQWAAARQWITEVLGDDVHQARTAPHLHAAGRRRAAPADRGRRLRRLLRLRAPRLQRRPDLPSRPGAAAAQLEAPAGRLPRPRRHRRRRRAPTSSGRAASARRPTDDAPTYGPSRRLDIEAELGFVVGTGSRLGERVATGDFADHTFGVVGLNDWSARDVQAWEYVPLGPFLGKSFATSISHWVTPLAALDAAWTDLPGQDPEPLDYLARRRAGRPRHRDRGASSTARSSRARRTPRCTGRPPRCSPTRPSTARRVRTGDLWGSGTISGPDAGPARLAAGADAGAAQEPFTAGGRERTFLEDGDEVTLRYTRPRHVGWPDRAGRGHRADRRRPAEPSRSAVEPRTRGRVRHQQDARHRGRSMAPRSDELDPTIGDVGTVQDESSGATSPEITTAASSPEDRRAAAADGREERQHPRGSTTGARPGSTGRSRARDTASARTASSRRRAAAGRGRAHEHARRRRPRRRRPRERSRPSVDGRRAPVAEQRPPRRGAADGIGRHERHLFVPGPRARAPSRAERFRDPQDEGTARDWPASTSDGYDQRRRRPGRTGPRPDGPARQPDGARPPQPGRPAARRPAATGAAIGDQSSRSRAAARRRAGRASAAVAGSTDADREARLTPAPRRRAGGTDQAEQRQPRPARGSPVRDHQQPRVGR